MTRNCCNSVKLLIRASEMPSDKYSIFGSLLVLANGRTATGLIAPLRARAKYKYAAAADAVINRAATMMTTFRWLILIAVVVPAVLSIERAPESQVVCSLFCLPVSVPLL